MDHFVEDDELSEQELVRYVHATKLKHVDYLMGFHIRTINNLEDQTEEKDNKLIDFMYAQLGFLQAWKGEILKDYEESIFKGDKPTILKLKITLQDVKPPIWRIIEVPSTLLFEELHLMIQTLFEWSDDGRHYFETRDDEGESILIIPLTEDITEDDEDLEYLEESSEILMDHISERNRQIFYTYDLKEPWGARIELMGENKTDDTNPRVLKGRRASPPENCGGPEGYEEILKDLNKLGRSEYVSAFIDHDFDPDRFDMNDHDISTSCIKRMKIIP